MLHLKRTIINNDMVFIIEENEFEGSTTYYSQAELDAKLKKQREEMLNIDSSMRNKCIGEFYVECSITDNDGDFYEESIIIPWTTVKDIYKAMINAKEKK